MSKGGRGRLQPVGGGEGTNGKKFVAKGGGGVGLIIFRGQRGGGGTKNLEENR